MVICIGVSTSSPLRVHLNDLASGVSFAGIVTETSQSYSAVAPGSPVRVLLLPPFHPDIAELFTLRVGVSSPVSMSVNEIAETFPFPVIFASPPSAAIDTVAAVAVNLAGAASCFTETVAVGFVPDEFVAVTVVLLSSRPVCGSALISTVPFPEPDAGETLHQLAFAILLNNFMGQGPG